MSSAAAERSQESEKFCGGHGAFTCALLSGLKGKADANANGLVELRELYDFIYRETKRLTDGLQNPSESGRYDNALPIAYVSGSARHPDVSGHLAALEAFQETTAFENGPAEASSKAEHWAEFLSRYPNHPDMAAQARARAAYWREEQKRMTETKRNWPKVSRLAKDDKLPVGSRLAAVRNFLASAPDQWPDRDEASSLATMLEKEAAQEMKKPVSSSGEREEPATSDRPSSPDPVPHVPEQHRFRVSGDVVIDPKTDLVWQRGQSKALNWSKAENYCQSLNVDAWSDWRVPDSKELKSLVEGEIHLNCYLPQEVFSGLCTWMWSKEESGFLSSTGIAVSAYTGNVGKRSKKHKCPVRCVRSE